MKIDYITVVKAGDLSPAAATAEIRAERVKLAAQACDTLKLYRVNDITIHDLRTVCRILGVDTGAISKLIVYDDYLCMQDEGVRSYED